MLQTYVKWTNEYGDFNLLIKWIQQTLNFYAGDNYRWQGSADPGCWKRGLSNDNYAGYWNPRPILASVKSHCDRCQARLLWNGPSTLPGIIEPSGESKSLSHQRKREDKSEQRKGEESSCCGLTDRLHYTSRINKQRHNSIVFTIYVTQNFRTNSWADSRQDTGR